jgi:hypothetical protein
MAMKFAFVAVLICLSLPASAEDSIQKQKNQVIAKADKLFGQRYTPVAGKPLRLYDKESETGPADSIIYWHGADYVIELVFAADGTIARVTMIPEALLHSDSWTDVEDSVELPPAEMQWLIMNANELQPLGKVQEILEAPDGCFQSGPNLYCTDKYELAIVSHYHRADLDKRRYQTTAMKNIEVLYRQAVDGIVASVSVVKNQRQLKVGGQWYHGEERGVRLFDEAQMGSVVHLITYGCTANRRACTGKPVEKESSQTGQ